MDVRARDHAPRVAEEEFEQGVLRWCQLDRALPAPGPPGARVEHEAVEGEALSPSDQEGGLQDRDHALAPEREEAHRATPGGGSGSAAATVEADGLTGATLVADVRRPDSHGVQAANHKRQQLETLLPSSESEANRSHREKAPFPRAFSVAGL